MTNQTHTVTLTETAKLLEEERARCAKLTAKLEREREKLRKARTDWAPAYKEWHAEEIAPLAARARELMQRARDQRAFVSQVEIAAIHLHCKPVEAAPLVQRALRGHVIFEELEYEFFETGRFPRGTPHPDVNAYLRLKFAREAYPRVKPEHFEEKFEEYKRKLFQSRFGVEPEPAPSPIEDAHLKRLYRELARRLHPDSNPNVTENERELWHEVTAAFRTQDKETLENVLAAYEAGDRFEAIDSLGRLRGILQRVEAKLRETARQLRREKKEPWWMFGKGKREREELARKLRAAEERSIQIAEFQLAELAARVKTWGCEPHPQGLNSYQIDINIT